MDEGSFLFSRMLKMCCQWRTIKWIYYL